MLYSSKHLILFILAGSTISAAPIEERGLGSRLLKGVKGSLFSGLGTYYDVGSGSCGEQDSNSDFVVAVNKAQMENGANPNNNPHCNTMVTITGDAGTVNARVEDTCPACANGALDMSPTVFEAVCGALSQGVCTITWNFV